MWVVLLAGGMAATAQAATTWDLNVTSDADSGVGTLRWAVGISNTTTGVQSIGFLLGNSITVHSLITISAPAIINGSGTQVIGSTGSGASGIFNFAPGSDGSTLTGCALVSSSRAVEFNADYCLLADCRLGVDYSGAARGNSEGIRVYHSNNVIRNCIVGSNQNGIMAYATAFLRVVGCYIGILPDDTARGNFVGVNVYQSVGCLVGGDSTDSQQKNIISRNAVGIIVHGLSNGNSICGNVIGLNTAMTAAAPNSDYGIRFASQAFGNYVGRPQANYGNVIAGNLTAGIYAYESSPGSQPRNNNIQNNLIGLNPSGAAFPNGTGILMTNADGFLIGGGSALERNVISGNTGPGIQLAGSGNTISGNYVGTDATGYTDLGNGQNGILLETVLAGSTTITSSGNLIGGLRSTGQGNVVSANNWEGIDLEKATHNEISGNLVGIAVNSTVLPNGSIGIYLGESTGNRIGRPDGDYGNVVSGNSSSGIYLTDNSDGNTLCGNIVGLARQQGSAVPNHAGISLNNAHHNYIGLPTGSYGRNVISGNNNEGIYLSDSHYNRIQNNLVGVSSGNAAFGNNEGITISNGHGNLIGGNRLNNEGNVISGNLNDGVTLDDSSGNTICGNIIGLSSDQTQARGNTDFGIKLGSGSGAHHNAVGLPLAGWGNIIGANDMGLYLSSADENTIQNNLLGVNSADASFPNLRCGIYMDAADHNLIGGPSAGNVIASGSVNEIYLQNSFGNTISANIINLNAAGNSLLANHNETVAIGFLRSYGNLIGGYAGNGNRICGRNTGLHFYDSSGNTAVGNIFGQFAGGQPTEASFAEAVVFSTNSHNNLLGDPAQGNQITGGSVGVSGEASTAFYNGFYRNLINGQSTKAISLTNNSNLGITAPVIASAIGQTITGQTQMFSDVVEVFQAEAAGNTYTSGGSLRYLGRAVVTGSGGPAPWSLVASSLGGEWVSATTSDTNHNTSEFSYNVLNTGPTATPTTTPIVTPTPTATTTPVGPTVTPTPDQIDWRGATVLAFPNPAKGRMTFAVRMEASGKLEVHIYNLTGERVAWLEEDVQAGAALLPWPCDTVAPGIYLARVKVNGREIVKTKVAVLK